MNPIKILRMSGGFFVALSNATITDTEVDPADSAAGLRLGTNGQATQVRLATGDTVLSGQWGAPLDAAQGANYEARFTPTIGTISSGSATSSWLALSSQREWTVSRTTSGTKSCTATVEIRRASDSVVVATATITLEATVL